MPECQRLSITVLNIHHLTLAWQPLPGPTQTFLPRSGACLSLPDGAYLTKNMTRRCKLDTVKGRVHYKKERYTLEPVMASLSSTNARKVNIFYGLCTMYVDPMM